MLLFVRLYEEIIHKFCLSARACGLDPHTDGQTVVQLKYKKDVPILCYSDFYGQANLVTIHFGETSLCF